MIPLLDLRRSFRSLERELLAAARRVLAEGTYILGPQVRQFEREFARICHAPHAVGVASGTDALELSLRACGVGPGDGVATVSFTFLATVDAIVAVGADPLFVDIDPRTYTLDPADLRRRIRALSPSVRRRIKAVLPVHLYGHPADMDGIRSVAREFHLQVIEDAAQAAGALWRGRPVGTFGAAGCFSFFPTKNLGGFGDGGMVATGSASIAAALRRLRVHGRDIGGRQRLRGRNSRLDELQAALLRVKLKRLLAWVARRRQIARLYTRRLSGLRGLQCPVQAPGAMHAYGLYVIRSPRRDPEPGLLLLAGPCPAGVEGAIPSPPAAGNRAGLPRGVGPPDLPGAAAR